MVEMLDHPNSELHFDVFVKIQGSDYQPILNPTKFKYLSQWNLSWSLFYYIYWLAKNLLTNNSGTVLQFMKLFFDWNKTLRQKF